MPALKNVKNMQIWEWNIAEGVPKPADDVQRNVEECKNIV